jgi:hypothetical protein
LYIKTEKIIKKTHETVLSENTDMNLSLMVLYLKEKELYIKHIIKKSIEGDKTEEYRSKI